MSPSEARTIYEYARIPAPPARVWRALTDTAEFAAWFQATADRNFEPSAVVRMVSTHPSANGVRFTIAIEEMTPERRFSWRWHPGAQQPPEGSNAPTTLVEFELRAERGGTMVTVVESGFEAIPAERRVPIYLENENGWKQALKALGNYLLRGPIGNR